MRTLLLVFLLFGVPCRNGCSSQPSPSDNSSENSSLDKMKERIAALVKSGDLNRATAIGGRPPDRKEKSGDPYFGGSRSAYTFAGEEILGNSWAHCIFGIAPMVISTAFGMLECL